MFRSDEKIILAEQDRRSPNQTVMQCSRNCNLMLYLQVESALEMNADGLANDT